jgi:hypothetical protein
MRHGVRSTIATLAVVGALLVGRAAPAATDAPDASDAPDVDARLDLRQQVQDRRGASPEPPAARRRAIALLRARAPAGDSTIRTQLRLEIQDDLGGADDGATGRGYLDEAYLRVAATEWLFVEIGKRQIVNGVGLGFNPTDYWAERKTIDRTVDDETRRTEREGDVLAGFSYFFEGGSLQAYVAPRLGNRLQDESARFMIAYTRTLADLDADATAIVHGGSRPALGLNLSTTVNDALVAYSEASFRRGRDRAKVAVSSGAEGVAYAVEPDDARLTVAALGGLQYTFGTGINVSAEYFRNGDGYSGKEADRIFALRRAASPGGPGAAAFGALQARTRELLSSRNLRRNYAFLRVGNIALSETGSLQLTTIRNLDDGSQFLRALAAFTVTDHDLLQASGDLFRGDPDAEYGLGATAARFLLLYRHHF